MTDKSKHGLDDLRGNYEQMVAEQKFAAAEEKRLRTVRMLHRLGIDCASEPGCEWVIVRDLRITLHRGRYSLEWIVRPIAYSGNGNCKAKVEGPTGEWWYRFERNRAALGNALAKATADIDRYNWGSQPEKYAPWPMPEGWGYPDLPPNADGAT